MSEQTQGKSVDVDNPKVYLIAAALGAGVGFISIGFLFAVKTAKELIWTSELERINPVVVLSICVVGGLLVGVLNQLAEKSRSEVHDLTEAIADMEDVETKQAPPARLIFGRAGLGVVSLGFGGPLGPEAPLIALVAQLSSRLSHILRVTQARVVELSVAGSLGVLFGVPLVLAGIESEEKAKNRNLGQRIVVRGPEIVAAISSLFVITKLLPEIGIHQFTSANSAEVGFSINLIWVALIAVLAASLGLAIVRATPKARELVVSKIPGGAIPAGLLSGLILGASAVVTPLVLFSGHHEIQEILDSPIGIGNLLVVVALKTLVLIACLAGGWYGGQIFPLAFIGAGTALLVAELVNSSATLGLVAAGFVAASAVGIRRPALALLLGFVLFPSTTYIPMLLATVIAVAVIGKRSAELPSH
ncbi:MAG: chloride channel protein [Actinobacteria bacterium]|nr:chloride channel protein [Actinomycetota bacterium]